MNKRKGSKFWFIIMAGFFLYFGYTMIKQQEVLYAKKFEMERIQAKIEEEEKLNEELKKQREMLSSDEYIEEIARKKLGMVRKNERVFIDVNK